MQNKKYEIYKVLVLPSALGAVVYTFISGLVIFLNQFSRIQQNFQLADNINVPRTILLAVDQNVNSHLGEGQTQIVVIGLFWALVGLVVYFCLRGLAHFIADVSDGLERRRYLWPQGTSRNYAVREAIARGIFQLFALIVLVIVLVTLLPRELSGPIGQIGQSLPKPVQYLLWFVALWLTLHLVVVLARLVAFKPRLFS